MPTRIRFVRCGAACAAVLLAALAGCSMPMMGGSSASVSATLSAAAEVPPNDSGGSGTLQGRYDRGTRVLSWKLVYVGLSGPATMAHFHGPASPGQNAGVVVPFANPASGSESSATLTEAQAADLLAGRWDVNVHTAAHPGGEIRGQVMVK
jgi:hypothetical protein